MLLKTDLLIIGAGPYGLAMAMYAQKQGIRYQVVGKFMGFWQSHMPSGMRLRTGFDWGNEETLNAYLEYKGQHISDAHPVAIESFVDYIQYTHEVYKLSILPVFVERLDYNNPFFTARLSNGERIQAQQVLVATGYYDFKKIPQEYQSMFPLDCYRHTANCNDFRRLKGKHCLIIGGRQGAFEWAGLLKDYARQVDIVYRHDTPEFAFSDWSWVYPYIQKTLNHPGWFRHVPEAERNRINQRFWLEGRSQLESWLLEMIEYPNVQLWPNTTVSACRANNTKSLSIRLGNGHTCCVDMVILATGYEPDINRLSWLAQGNILSQLAYDHGFVCLDDSLQSNIPGLYFTGIHAVNDFGPFFFFVACADTAAQIVGRNLV